jgi:hypothetical protein
MKKHFYIFGIISLVTYVLAVVIGGFLIPEYNHLNQAISEIEPLIKNNAKYIVTSLFTVYNVCALCYGISQYNIFKKKTIKVQAICISLISLFGILMYFFPMDIVGSDVTVKGVIHIALAGLMAPLTVAVCFLGYFSYKSNKKMSIYSLLTSIIILVCGGSSAYLTANSLPFMGLLERITIGSYVLWLFITAIYYRNIKEDDLS